MRAGLMMFQEHWSSDKPSRTQQTSVREVVAARLKKARPLFSASQLEAAAKLEMPAHLFQGEDVKDPDLA